MKTFMAILLLQCLIFTNGVLQAQRNPYTWPFSEISIWNMPIHKNAKYIPAQIKPPTKRGMTCDEDIIILSPSSPLTPIYISSAEWDTSKDRCQIEGGQLFSAPIPANFVYNKDVWSGLTPNSALAVLMPDGHTIKQTQPFARCDSGIGYPATSSKYSCPDVDIFGEGRGGAHGGSGLSSIGGTIRLGELIPSGTINHVLKCNIFGNKCIFYDDSTKGYRWPAFHADRYADTSYHGVVKELRMGALLALPPSIDINTMGLETEPGKILAEAFQNYGAYLVDDTNWDVVGIATEFGPSGNVRDEFKKNFGFDYEEQDLNTPWTRDIAKIFINLSVVDNNDESNIGGGPTSDTINRRAPMAGIFDTTTSVNQVPVDAQHPYPFINYSRAPTESFKWGQAWFQAVTLKNDHTPNDGYVEVDYIALIEEDSASGKDTILHIENYNGDGALTMNEGGLYDRFPFPWFKNNTFSAMTNSNQSKGILTIKVGQQPDSINHFWGERRLCQTIGKRYKVQASILIHGDIALQAGMDYWVDTITTSVDTLHHKEAFLSKWFGATNGKYDTITCPLYNQLPEFDSSDYGFDKNGRFYISKKLIDYVSGYQVDLYCNANNWRQPLPMTLNLKGDSYEFYTGIPYNSVQEYCFHVNSTINPNAQNKFYLPTAVINYLVYRDKDTMLNPTKDGYNFYTYPNDFINFTSEKDGISHTYELQQNYPNPFNPSTNIAFRLPAKSFVSLKVFDLVGREVVTLMSQEKPVGTYNVTFDASKLPSGVYFYHLQAGTFIETKKLVLLR